MSGKTFPKKPKPLNQHEKLERDLKSRMGDDWDSSLSLDLPKKWKLAGHDLLILPANSFNSPHWSRIDRNQMWAIIAECFKVSRVCKETRVHADGFRSPNLELVFGADPNVTVVNNGIT